MGLVVCWRQVVLGAAELLLLLLLAVAWTTKTQAIFTNGPGCEAGYEVVVREDNPILLDIFVTTSEPIYIVAFNLAIDGVEIPGEELVAVAVVNVPGPTYLPYNSTFLAGIFAELPPNIGTNEWVLLNQLLSVLAFPGAKQYLATFRQVNSQPFPLEGTCLIDITTSSSPSFEQRQQVQAPVGSFSECCNTQLCFPVGPISGVFSDPHFKGLRGQTYDVTGEDGQAYNLIRDNYLIVNALFSTAYATGISVDAISLEFTHYHPEGTWISEMGLIFVNQHTKEMHEVLVRSASSFACSGSCLLSGEVQINGHVADKPQTYVIRDVARLTLSNFNSFSRVHVDTSAEGNDAVKFTANLDLVPPPSEWKIPASQASAYSHINMNLETITVSDAVNGILGCSSRPRKVEGKPIMTAEDNDGTGILEGPVDAYRVSSISDSSFPLLSEEWLVQLLAYT